MNIVYKSKSYQVDGTLHPYKNDGTNVELEWFKITTIIAVNAVNLFEVNIVELIENLQLIGQFEELALEEYNVQLEYDAMARDREQD